MAEDGSAPTTVADPSADPVSEAALAAYARRMRPWRIGYAVAIVVVVAVALVIVKIAYDHGEISHVRLHTVASAPPSISTAPTPTAALTRAWSTSDATAIGTPAVGGTVVAHSAHTVRGRDAITGRQTWSYTRTDRTVCAAIQTDNVTIAVYRLHGDCDELTALDSETGARRWTRTLDKDGAVFDGPASYSVDGGNVLFVSRTSIYAVAVGGTADQGNGGLDYWTFFHVGCTINGATLGDAGALISQTCHGEDCQSRKYCGNGTQLLLRDATAGYDEKSTTNPDKIKWNDLGSDLVPTSAGATVTARDPDGATLHVLKAANGTQSARLPLVGDSGSSAPAGVQIGTDADLIWIGGRTYALGAGDTSFRWQLATAGVPTVANTMIFTKSAALAPTASGAVLFDPATGRSTRSYPVAPPAPGSRVLPLGSGLLVAGAHTLVYR